MPKMRTNRSAAKRYLITGTGKIRRRKGFRSHLLEHKPAKRKLRLGRIEEVSSADRRAVKKMLGR